MILVIDRKGAVVRYERDAVLIEKPDGDKQRVPINMIEQIVVHGNPLLDAGFLRAIAARGVGLTCLMSRGKGADAVLGAGLASQLPFRRMQFSCALDEQKSVAVARWVVSEKILSYSLPLHADETSGLDGISTFNRQRDVALKRLNACESVESLMGVEGALANAWFSLLADSVDKEWSFKGRNRQPPRDPLNAMLSLGYTLLGGVVRQVLVSEGLDPSQGFLHQDYPGREALVLDLVEPFRAGVDGFCLSLLEELDPDDFSHSEEQGCRLLKDARPLFYEAWAARCEDWPRMSSALEESLRYGSLQEQVRGKTSELRECLKSQLDKD